jgi:hypothetical protein
MTKRCKKLTKEQRKAVWSGPESNAGAGWNPRRAHAAEHAAKRRSDPLYGEDGEPKELCFED